MKKQRKMIVIVILIAVFSVPIILLSLKSLAVGWSWGELLPSDFSLRGWSVVLNDPKIVAAISVTYKIAIAVILLNLLIAIPTGRALAFYSFKGKGVIETILFMPILIPALAIAMGIHLTMIKLGLADQWLGVVLVHLIPTVPYSIRILRSGFERVGMKWEEQSFTLGGTTLSTFWLVMFPLLLPSLRAAIYLTYVISLSQYVLTALIGGGNVVTLAMLYYPYFSSVDDMVIASFSLMFALLPLLFIVMVELVIRVTIFIGK
ncbi:ABC transporter permease subunit [Bacillaceae bacterium IKA-2]|nr:ABC transporter permease subunit [Bacillaceae bacterium IKA-2]